MAEQSNTKRLAKNTILMYFRMGFLMLISLYTSRVILRQLGVEDYGIYNLVGSIVVMFISLKSIFASSTQRFLNYEMGRGNNDKLQLIYTMSTAINAIISVIFVVLVEIVGLWFLAYKINIAPDRLVAAQWVFQFSVIATVISIMSTPLDAEVIAHERMDFYAYLSIFDGLAKLGICYLITIADYDKLIVYGFLTLVVSIIVRIINQTFCMRYFPECHLKKCWDKKYFKDMTSFAGWAFFGNTANMLSQSGLNMVLNVFGGPVVNAARGLSYQVSNALNQFIGNITVVVKPYSIKTYASGQVEKAFDFSFLISKVYFYIQLSLTIIVTFLAEYLLRLWLGQVPEYTVAFLDLVMIQFLIRSLHMPIDMLYGGAGDIKYYQIAEGIILALPVPVGYILLRLGLPYASVFWGVIVFEVIHIWAITTIANRVFKFPLWTYFKKVAFPCIICTSLYAVLYFVNTRIGTNMTLNITGVIISLLIISIFVLYILLTKSERLLILNLIKNRKE